MKILLTNDDGIYSEGIQILKKQLDNIAEVMVIAPDRERSTIGHAITLRKPLRIRKIKINGDFWGFSLDGTPADCVIIGLLEIMKDEKPDLIVSGINRGPFIFIFLILKGLRRVIAWPIVLLSLSGAITITSAILSNCFFKI